MSSADSLVAPRLPLVAISIALLLGTVIGYIDSRPTWDDTGITVGAVLISSVLVAASAPRMGWLAGALVGLPILLFNVLLTGNWGSVGGLIFSVIGGAI